MSTSITTLTFNLRFDNKADGDNAWEKRRDLCADVFKKYRPIIACTQEGLKHQLDYLKAALPGYDYFGVSRGGPDDPNNEHCAIFFDTSKVERVDGGTFWLSETPSVPGSQSWGAGKPRIATWATFRVTRVQPPGFVFHVMNTHLDHKSQLARKREALLTWQHLATLPASQPVIFAGDFNTDKDSEEGRFLLGRGRIQHERGDMRDAWQSARRRRNGGVIYTFHGFGGEKMGLMECFKSLYRTFCLCWDRHYQDLHLDWILFRGRQLAPVFCEVVTDNKDGRYPSDHYPVYVEFLLPRNVRLVDGAPAVQPALPSTQA